MKLSLTFCVTNGKDKYYFSNIQAGIVDMQPNVRRYVTFASPDPWGGDGVVFADPAHDRTIF